MSRGAATVVLVLLASLIGGVEAASAAGPSVTYTLTAGTAGTNGWYTSDVTAQIQVSGATDTNCPVVKTFRSSSDSLDCTATDGSSTVTFHLQFKIDKDAPAVTGSTVDHGPNANGWYNGPVTVSFAGTDATSGIASCTQAAYSGPDSGTASVSGTCTDVAGNISASSTASFKYDATAPTVTGSPARPPDANGWYNHAVAVAFTGSDAGSGIDSCSSTSYGGPDSGGTTVTGTCTDKAGNSATGSFALQYDSTPPEVKAVPARAPDANGWYNHPVALTVTGTDAGSGIDSCTGANYEGPDSASASVTGTCLDKAGNKTARPVTLQYDDTPPKLSDLSVTTGNGTATLHWTASSDVSSVTVERTPGPNGSKDAMIYKGDARSFTDVKLQNGLHYRYELSAVDHAGNVATAGKTAVPLALASPRQGQVLKHPPLLRWTAVPGAGYYNVQLFFKGHKVLSSWPVGTSLRVPSSWTFAGHTHTLAGGLYRWYVWPGVGNRAAARYGKLLGGSSFSIR